MQKPCTSLEVKGCCENIVGLCDLQDTYGFREGARLRRTFDSRWGIVKMASESN